MVRFPGREGESQQIHHRVQVVPEMRAVLSLALALCLGAVTLANVSPKHFAKEAPRREVQLQQPDAEEVARVASKVAHQPLLAASLTGGTHATKSDGRILFGQHPGSCSKFSYQVALLTSDGYFCGGSLICSDWVLTAAHCISAGATWILVFAGSEFWASAPVRVYASSAIIHGGYNDWAHNDIALLQLYEAVPFSDCVQPVGLETVGCGDSSLDGELAVASGWGLTSDSSNSVEDWLWYVHAQVTTNEICRSYYGYSIIDGTLCTFSANGSNGTLCSGDSGGPLVWKASRRQIGINSFVHINGCESGAPNGYARVPCYYDWIRAIVPASCFE